MHVKRHMSFEYFESKNQLGKFTVAPHLEARGPWTCHHVNLLRLRLCQRSAMARAVECRALYTLRGRQIPAVTSEVGGAWLLVCESPGLGTIGAIR
jgi:hypothetical protein